MTKAQIQMENAALRSQISLFQQHLINVKIPKPRCNNTFRQLWVFLSKHFSDWKSVLIIVKPETVIRWHKTAFKLYWKRKTQSGQPKKSHETIALIKRIHKENPTLSPEKIYERLVDLNITDTPAPNTISKYIKDFRIPPIEKQKQSWQSFLCNHAKCIWAMDFAVVPTLTFKPLYVLIVISHYRRKIEHFAVTEHPTAAWMIQQIRNATPFGKQLKYLIHDNGGMFIEKTFQQFLTKCNIISKRITYRSPWQNGICERTVGILRRELFDHIIPLDQRHLERLLEKYVKYYNNTRTHQTLDGETPVQHDRPPLTPVKNTSLKSKPILGGLYHSYDKVA